jgi:hypothetical protein
MGAGRDVVRIDDGEEARLTPRGPHAAVVASRGYLPLRYREEDTPTRAAFPGTCVVLPFGEDQYEVVTEEADGDTVTYGLRAWPRGEVVRQVVAYGPPLVRAAQAERQRVAQRDRSAPYRFLLAPLLGLLPEERQARACDAVGLHAGQATAASGAVEAAALYLLFNHAIAPASSTDRGIDVWFWAVIVPAVLGTVILSGVWRALWGLVLGEAAGSALLWPFFALFDGARARLHDPTLVPLTRSAFWTRLALPDRVIREGDGSVRVRSLLPHLTWESARRVRFGDDWWEVEALPPAHERGRLVHQYRLAPPPDAGPGPMPHSYADEVMAGVRRSWEDLLTAGAGPLLVFLPEVVQQRAFAARGGPGAARALTIATALGQVAFAVWLLFSGLAGALLVAAWCGGEGAFRLHRAANGRFGPSLLGHAFADLLPPEREAYHAHRDAEARALRGA